ncbi:hypothetical protein DPSP01_014188 [Paraphaeosphaeria sporulosa]
MANRPDLNQSYEAEFKPACVLLTKENILFFYPASGGAFTVGDEPYKWVPEGVPPSAAPHTAQVSHTAASNSRPSRMKQEEVAPKNVFQQHGGEETNALSGRDVARLDTLASPNDAFGLGMEQNVSVVSTKVDSSYSDLCKENAWPCRKKRLPFISPGLWHASPLTQFWVYKLLRKPSLGEVQPNSDSAPRNTPNKPIS